MLIFDEVAAEDYVLTTAGVFSTYPKKEQAMIWCQTIEQYSELNMQLLESDNI